jgi:hypothetical protein
MNLRAAARVEEAMDDDLRRFARAAIFFMVCAAGFVAAVVIGLYH